MGTSARLTSNEAPQLSAANGLALVRVTIADRGGLLIRHYRPVSGVCWPSRHCFPHLVRTLFSHSVFLVWPECGLWRFFFSAHSRGL